MQRDYRVRGFVIGRKLAVQRMIGETDYLHVACPQVLMSVATEAIPQCEHRPQNPHAHHHVPVHGELPFPVNSLFLLLPYLVAPL
ncbi:MAG TPA: hypothetical protein VIR61_06295 [Sulfuricaulis sp.]